MRDMRRNQLRIQQIYSLNYANHADLFYCLIFWHTLPFSCVIYNFLDLRKYELRMPTEIFWAYHTKNKMIFCFNFY